MSKRNPTLRTVGGVLSIGLMILFIVSVILGATIWDANPITLAVQAALAVGCYVIAYNALRKREE